MHQVVVVGGGVAGLAAVRALRFADVRVTLLDRRNYHLFKSLLPQAAAGAVPESDLAFPFRTILRKQPNAEFRLAEAVYLEPERKRVILADGTLPYDSLIVATGSVPSFDEPSWARLSTPLNSLEDAQQIRSRIHLALEQATRLQDTAAQKDLLRFVVLLGPETPDGTAHRRGIEFAAALVETLRLALKHDFPSLSPEIPQVLVVTEAGGILDGYPKPVARAVEQMLIKTGIEFIYNRRLESLRATEPEALSGSQTFPLTEIRMALQHGSAEPIIEKLSANNVFWLGPLRAQRFLEAVAHASRLQLDPNRRALAEPRLVATGLSGLRLAGSLTTPTHPAQSSKTNSEYLQNGSLRSAAQGRYAARSIIAELRGEEVPQFELKPAGRFLLTHPTAASGTLRSALPGTLSLGKTSGWMGWLISEILPLTYEFNRTAILATVAGMRTRSTRLQHICGTASIAANPSGSLPQRSATTAG